MRRREKDLEASTLEDALVDPERAEEPEVLERAQCFTCMDIFFKSCCLTFGCAWLLFLLVFGTGKFFIWFKNADGALTW